MSRGGEFAHILQCCHSNCRMGANSPTLLNHHTRQHEEVACVLEHWVSHRDEGILPMEHMLEVLIPRSRPTKPQMTLCMAHHPKHRPQRSHHQQPRRLLCKKYQECIQRPTTTAEQYTLHTRFAMSTHLSSPTRTFNVACIPSEKIGKDVQSLQLQVARKTRARHGLAA